MLIRCAPFSRTIYGFVPFARTFALKKPLLYASRLFEESECEKLKIEITAQKWDLYETKMLRVLGIAHQEAPSCQAKDGTYVNALLGASFSIKDNILTDPEGVHRRLSAKTPTEFFIECWLKHYAFSEMIQ